MHLNILPNLWLIFCTHQQKIWKWAIFDILMTITLGVNMITRQMILFFSSTLWALSVGIFHFCISRPSKFTSVESPPLHYGLFFRIQIYMPKMGLSIDIFFYIKYADFWYICLQFDTNLAPVPWSNTDIIPNIYKVYEGCLYD